MASHHRGSFVVRSARVRELAYSDPGTRCWRCGLTLDEASLRAGRQLVWHAGHSVDGDSSAALLAECSLCNTRAGAFRGNASRVLNPSRRWF